MSLNMFGELAPTESMLNFHMERHSVLSANLANSETPGYVPHDLVAPTTAGTGAALERTHENHIPVGGGGELSSVIELEQPRVDGNGVQMEQAMAAVSANRLRYEAGIEVARRQLALLRYAATDGGL